MPQGIGVVGGVSGQKLDPSLQHIVDNLTVETDANPIDESLIITKSTVDQRNAPGYRSFESIVFSFPQYQVPSEVIACARWQQAEGRVGMQPIDGVAYRTIATDNHCGSK